jgi:hypothetical protein
MIGVSRDIADALDGIGKDLKIYARPNVIAVLIRDFVEARK